MNKLIVLGLAVSLLNVGSVETPQAEEEKTVQVEEKTYSQVDKPKESWEDMVFRTQHKGIRYSETYNYNNSSFSGANYRGYKKVGDKMVGDDEYKIKYGGMTLYTDIIPNTEITYKVSDGNDIRYKTNHSTRLIIQVIKNRKNATDEAVKAATKASQ